MKTNSIIILFFSMANGFCGVINLCENKEIEGLLYLILGALGFIMLEIRNLKDE